jgi:hypothetical protein
LDRPSPWFERRVGRADSRDSIDHRVGRHDALANPVCVWFAARWRLSPTAWIEAEFASCSDG